MSTEMMIIIGLAVVALIIAVILAANEGRPKVTTIEHRREKDSDDA
jgi:multisubunit Na+/H+ antiporter MnhC subunit